MCSSDLQGPLPAYLPPPAERAPQGFLHGLDCGEVPAPLRLRYDELTPDELDRVARLEEAGFDQSLVLDPPPPARLDAHVSHVSSVAIRGRPVNALRRRHL